jgi:hypothetical protein
MSLSSGDEVPHIFTRKSRIQPKEILITSVKRLLQQNLPQPNRAVQHTKMLFDNLIGGHLHDEWRRETEHSCGLTVDNQLELARLHDRQVRGLGALEDFTCE